ncbi:hypothetical protein BD311DRAFT_811450 [Dichomitus squalens]|uniref:Uncharacterized protein n=1 Tax=Dichomitus squalens TaxID=114155 RepID=A0A4Q9M6L2_9APHY|nr:hypothetical protein BD311DRAFT_811450 [Dichomitus squalens]
MRFLHTRTGRFCWVDDPKETAFAILSHVWITNPPPPGEVPEQSYEEVLRIAQITLPDKDSSILPMLHREIQKFCEVALKDGFDLCWLRSSFTLCIPHRHTGLEVALQRDENIHKSLKEVSQFFEFTVAKTGTAVEPSTPVIHTLRLTLARDFSEDRRNRLEAYILSIKILPHNSEADAPPRPGSTAPIPVASPAPTSIAADTHLLAASSISTAAVAPAAPAGFTTPVAPATAPIPATSPIFATSPDPATPVPLPPPGSSSSSHVDATSSAILATLQLRLWAFL